MTSAMMTHLPRFVPAQREAAQATAERRARMSAGTHKAVNRELAPLHESLSAETGQTLENERMPARTTSSLNLRPGKRSEPPKVHDIQRAVCVYLGTRLEDMVGTSKRAQDVHPRQLAMYLAVQLTAQSENEIARRFGRDGTTLRYGCRKIELALNNDPLYARAISELREILS